MRSSKPTYALKLGLREDKKKGRRHLGFSVSMLFLLNSYRMLCCFRVSSKLFGPNKSLRNIWTNDLSITNNSIVQKECEDLTTRCLETSYIFSLTYNPDSVALTFIDLRPPSHWDPIILYGWLGNWSWIECSKNALLSELFEGQSEWWFLFLFIYFY